METVALSCVAPPPGTTSHCHDVGRPAAVNAFTVQLALLVTVGVVALVRIFRS